MSAPVPTAAEALHTGGTPAPVGVGVHPSVDGLYRPPVLEPPPQISISDPVQKAKCPGRGDDIWAPHEVGAHAFVAGLYRPPELSARSPAPPPQTTISDPVQTAVWADRACGRFAPRAVAVQLSLSGSYRPPVLSTR